MSSPYFEVIFAGYISEDQTELKKIVLVSCKIFLFVHLEITRGPLSRAWAILFYITGILENDFNFLKMTNTNHAR